MRDTVGSGRGDLALAEESYEIVAGPPEAGLIVLCDHACNALPPGYGTLGLAEKQLERHIGYDIGASGVVKAMAARLGATAVLSRYSRLLIDLNRGAGDPTLVMQLSDGAIVPGNRGIDAAEIGRRIRLYHEPYHRAITWAVERCLTLGIAPVILSVHSFTDAWKGVARPWHIGILWDQDRRLPRLMLDGLRRDPALVVGDNQPYSGQLDGDCLNRHATRRGLAHALIEIRQDLIADAAGQLAWAERLSVLIGTILADPQRLAALRRPALSNSQSKETMLMPTIDQKTQTELEAAAFRKLVEHLRTRTDVQNIDLMNLAGFCRNCLSNWYKEAADAKGLSLSKDESRTHIYGMSYDEWRSRHQKESSPDQARAFATAKPHGH